MRSSRSYLPKEDKDEMDNIPSIRKATLLRLGKPFVMIVLCFVIFSMFACAKGAGEYRAGLSDASDALSKVYKDDVIAMKSYQDVKDDNAYKSAKDSVKELKDKFQAIADVKPSNNFKVQYEQIKGIVAQVVASLDKVDDGIDNFKKTGDINQYKNAFVDNYQLMQNAIEQLNKIFTELKAKQQ